MQDLCFTVNTLGERVHPIGLLSDQVQNLVFLHKSNRSSRGRINRPLSQYRKKVPIGEGTQKVAGTYEDLVSAQVNMSSAAASDVDGGESIADCKTPIQSLSRQSTLVDAEADPPKQSGVRVQSFPNTTSMKACPLDCSCACHRRNRLKSPELFNTLFGSLHVGYKALPCDKSQCRSQATKIRYAFPQWLLRRTIAFSMSYSQLQGPDLCLRMVRNRPGDSDIFTAVFRGQVDHVRRLIGDGQASVIDVDPDDNTPLHV